MQDKYPIAKTGHIYDTYMIINISGLFILFKGKKGILITKLYVILHT